MSYFAKRAKQFHTDFKTEIAKFPKNALIELTNGCNHACIFCKNSNQDRKASFLPTETFVKFVTEAQKIGLEEVGFYTTGEPFMSKNLEEFIGIAKNAKIKRVYITTNGALANLDRVKSCVDAGLDSIKFSINASNAEDYKLVHGFDDFEKVLKNVTDIYNWKKINNINLQLLCSCIVIPSLPNTMVNHKKIFNRFFEDILYLSSASQGGQAHDINITTEEISGVFSNFNSLNKDQKTSPCDMLWDRYHLTAEGYLTACCVDYNLNLVFGDIKSNSLGEIWNNEIMKNLRNKHLTGDLDNTICKQCLRNKKFNYSPITFVKSKQKNKNLLNKENSLLIERIKKISKLKKNA